MSIITSPKTHTMEARRLQALEIIHAVDITDSNPGSVYDQIVLAIADILETPLTMIHEFGQGVKVYNGQLTHIQSVHHCSTCLEVSGSSKVCQFACKKNTQSIEASNFPHNGFKSFLCSPILDPAGVPIGAVCAFAEHERKFIDNETHFVDLFAQYLSKELARKQHQAHDKRSFEQKLLVQLASGITHEVRNRLNGIFVNTEALFQNIGDDSELHTFQWHIRQQVTCLATLMEDLMALVRPIENENIKEVSTSSLISEALSYWRKSVPETIRKVNYILQSPTNLIIKADDTRLKQGLVKLFANAHDHAPGKAEIQLSVSSVQNHWVKIRIGYSGAGIAPEILSQAFEPFIFTGQSSTGLGLSIVKHIVECHGGTISMFNNNIPSGVIIELNLPLSE
jgi:signal transduction histidine kinase